MDSELLQIIRQYQADVLELVPKLAQHLEVDLPVTNIEWSISGIENRGTTADGMKYFKHGYGVALQTNQISVDVDFGDEGQINGFDAWRIWTYIEENKINTK